MCIIHVNEKHPNFAKHIVYNKSAQCFNIACYTFIVLTAHNEELLHYRERSKLDDLKNTEEAIMTMNKIHNESLKLGHVNMPHDITTTNANRQLCIQKRKDKLSLYQLICTP